MIASATGGTGIRNALSVAAWLALLCALALALSLARVRLREWEDGRVPAGTSAGEPAPSRSLFAPSAVLEPLGRFPPGPLTYDPTIRGRLYAGGRRSDDGGRSWHPLQDAAGRGVLPLRRRWLNAAAGPNARLLLGEVLFEEPGVATGLGSLAHAVEWRDGGWTTLLPDDEELWLDGSGPRLRVCGLGYLPDGRSVVATTTEVRLGDGGRLQPPAGLRRLLVARNGDLYAAAGEAGSFGLYVATNGSPSFLPVPGVDRVEAMGEGVGGVVILAVGGRIGRGGRRQWQWTDTPRTLTVDQLAAHPALGLLAAWGRGGLAVARDGRSLVTCRLGAVRVQWAAWDPFATDLTVVSPQGDAYLLKLETPQ